jgi:hypothetical protein
MREMARDGLNPSPQVITVLKVAPLRGRHDDRLQAIVVEGVPTVGVRTEARAKAGDIRRLSAPANFVASRQKQEIDR